MSERLDTSFLDDALKYASQETRYRVADALACHLHNDGYQLEGNTEPSDVEWFARNIYERCCDDHYTWERAGDGDRDSYREVARAVMAVLPAFQLRIAHRLITLSKVVRDIERAERGQHKRASLRAGLPPEEGT
jgi:hypothetical protein